MRKFLGIDPGSKGAISIINEDGTFFNSVDIPKIGKYYDLRKINQLISEHQVHFAHIEFQQVMGKEGIVTAFTIGFGYGILVMALEANNIPYEEIRPTAWKKEMGLINKDKAASVRMAQKMYPEGEFVGPRGGLYDGRAESCLLAESARRKSLQLSTQIGDF